MISDVGRRIRKDQLRQLFIYTYEKNIGQKIPDRCTERHKNGDLKNFKRLDTTRMPFLGTCSKNASQINYLIKFCYGEI